METSSLVLSLKEFYDNQKMVENAYMAGRLDEVRNIIDPKNSITSDELETIFQYFLAAMKDDSIRNTCSPTLFAYMLLKAYKDEKIDDKDLKNVGKDYKKDNEILDIICKYEASAKLVLE